MLYRTHQNITKLLNAAALCLPFAAGAVPITEPGQLDAPTDLIDFNSFSNLIVGPQIFASSIGAAVLVSGADHVIDTDLYAASTSFPT